MEIRPTTRADLAALEPLFSAAFGAPFPGRDWIWKYHENPNPAFSVGAFEGGRALGFYGGWGTRYRGAEGQLPGVSATDVMTDPRVRGLGRRGVFRDIGEEAFRLNAERGVPFFFGFPSVRHRLVGERLMGYRSVEPAGALGRALPIPRRRPGVLRRLRGTRLAVTRVAAVGGEHDGLAEALHARAGWRSDRASETLNWRFARRPGVEYLLYEALDPRRRSHAFAAIRTIGERAHVVDLQLLDESSGVLVDLVASAADAVHASGAARLVVRCPPAGALSRRLVAELGFTPEEPDVHFEVRHLLPEFDLDRAAPLFDYRFSDQDVF